MNITKKIGLLTILMISVAGFTQSASGQSVKDTSYIGRQVDSEDGYENEDKMIRKMTKKLGLSTDQQEKLKALKTQESPDFREKRNSMKAAHEKLEEAMKGSATEDEIRAQYSELEKLQSEFARARLEKVLAIRAILTPDQRQKFKGMGHGEFRKKHRRK